ncbi:MAG TPA: hypothetical protein DGX96_05185 [Lachnospiraceae bacterium]|jgi:phage host-nuclease inhibitor protein Gam|nr:hypothetical protein [Lachnospiraceae bacterium]
MDKKSVGEIRKLMTKNNCRIDKITGYFVNEDGSVITPLKETWNAMQEEEVEKYCEIFRKTLTGKIGKNLFDFEFPLSEEGEGGKQAAFYDTLMNGFDTPEMLQHFCENIMNSFQIDSKYLLLLAHGAYDIPAKTKDNLDLDDASEYVYLFLIGAICPVAELKEGLCYDAQNLTFINKNGDLAVKMPDIGFVYPAFNDREPDIHHLWYYCRKEDERHIELISGVVGEATEVPQTQTQQREIFNELMENALGRDCDFESVKAVNDAVNQMIHQDEDNPEPLELGKTQIRRIVADAGLPDETVDAVDEAFDETVGEGNTITADNVGGRPTMEIKSPSIRISVKSDMTAMISTKVIDGREYIVIPVQDDVEVNGVRILTTRKDKETEEE